MRHLRLHVTSDPANLAPVRRAVEAFCASCGFNSVDVGNIGLSVNEAMANVTRHAYGGAADRPIAVEAQFSNDQLELTIRDWGCGRNPPEAKEPHERDPMSVGGLGLICLKQFMDDVKFEPQDAGMKLTMRKRKSAER
jgi:anti-sigma regulatory factor (Ser/Thr protein kinase)